METRGTLAFAQGEETKTLSITLLNDGLLEEQEFFEVALNSPSSSLLLGDSSINSVSIEDNDPGVSLVRSDGGETEGELWRSCSGNLS